jgi:hypothetical protein
MLSPPPSPEEERVEGLLQREAEQRVIDETPTLIIPRITDAPGIMESRNPMAKHTFKATPRTHWWVTWNNMPGIMPAPVSLATYTSIPSGVQQRIVTQHAINALTCNKWENMNLTFKPMALIPSIVENSPSHIEQYDLPMMHPVTGKTISSYKKLMNNHMMTEIWQMAFGKDFGGMVQVDNKTSQKETNAMFVMMHDEIKHILRQKKKFTYGNLAVDYPPQEEDPNRIQIIARGNLVMYELSPLVCTAVLGTAKLHWNSVISTQGAKYMCLDIKKNHLTARLEYFLYMQMPLVLFPEWIQEQYNLKLLAYKGNVHLEMRRAVWGLPQAGILANKRLWHKLALLGCCKHVNTPGLWYHESHPISFTLIVNNIGVKYVNKEDVNHLVKSMKKHVHSPKTGH